MSFGGFIKKRGLRIKMRNYDPYKKTILFFASLVNIVLMSLVFMYVWFHYYAATMFVATFYRKGHYAMIGLYALILFFFSTMYGSMKIGQQHVSILSLTNEGTGGLRLCCRSISVCFCLIW